MRKAFLSIAFVAAVAGAQAPLQAAFITGSQAFISTATTSASNTISDTVFTLHFATLSGGINQKGDFAGEVASFVNILDTNAAATFAFGNAAFGTFTVSSVDVNSMIAGISRTVNLSGTFNPGTDFGGAFGPTPAGLTITINQASPGVLSASATLSANAVPEPSTIVLLGTFCIPAAAGWLRRRRSAIS